MPDIQLDVTDDQIGAAIGGFAKWDHQCHGASLALVRSGILGPEARVARGACIGVGGQHSWVVVGNPYDDEAPIIDVTLWSYDAQAPQVWRGSLMYDRRHRPHGFGYLQIDEDTRPDQATDDPIILEPAHLSGWAWEFQEWAGNLDMRGWMRLFHGPLLGWPSAEILEYLLDRYSGFAALVPIDVVGMLTDRNPGGLYR